MFWHLHGTASQTLSPGAKVLWRCVVRARTKPLKEAFPNASTVTLSQIRMHQDHTFVGMGKIHLENLTFPWYFLYSSKKNPKHLQLRLKYYLSFWIESQKEREDLPRNKWIDLHTGMYIGAKWKLKFLPICPLEKIYPSQKIFYFSTSRNLKEALICMSIICGDHIFQKAGLLNGFLIAALSLMRALSWVGCMVSVLGLCLCFFWIEADDRRGEERKQLFSLTINPDYLVCRRVILCTVFSSI